MPAGTAHHGFTLIEILVALAILAIALTALAGSSQTLTSNQARMQEKTIALWVAEDRLNEYRITQQWPPATTQTGKRALAGSEWQWTTRRNTTSSSDIYHLSVDVVNVNEADRIVLTLDTYYAAYTRSRRSFGVRR